MNFYYVLQLGIVFSLILIKIKQEIYIQIIYVGQIKFKPNTLFFMER
jgi:hypothetical protein